MPKAHQEWTVLPHGRLAAVDDDLWTVTGTIHMPLCELPRRMTVARIAGDEPQIPRPALWTMIDDKEALRDQFLRWAELPDLRRILVSHGAAIEFQPAEALRDLAHSLSYDVSQHGSAKAA